MTKIGRFEDLTVWQAAREFCREIFIITQKENFNIGYRFKAQIRASSGSVMDNIAEGFERGGTKEHIQFLYIAKASCGETRSQPYRALDFNTLQKKSLSYYMIKQYSYQYQYIYLYNT